jgi:hypothetical protein
MKKQEQQTTTSKHFIKRETPANGFGKVSLYVTGTTNSGHSDPGPGYQEELDMQNRTGGLLKTEHQPRTMMRVHQHKQ